MGRCDNLKCGSTRRWWEEIRGCTAYPLFLRATQDLAFSKSGFHPSVEATTEGVPPIIRATIGSSTPFTNEVTNTGRGGRCNHPCLQGIFVDGLHHKVIL